MKKEIRPFKSEKSNLHSEHRERMYRRFTRDLSLDGFAQHEVIEMLLFRSIHLKNTSEIAHRLIDKFGSILKVLQASPSELKEIKGMTDRAALDLSIMYHAFKLLPASENTAVQFTLDSASKVVEYVQNRMMYENFELVYIICLDSADKVININSKTEYLPQNVALNVRTIIKTAAANNASKVILVHNHPSGNPNPSREDDLLTAEAAITLAAIDIPLLDHIIIAKDKHFSYNNTNFIYGSISADKKYNRIRDQLSDFSRKTRFEL